MINHLKNMLAGRSLPSRKTWISVDWKKIIFISLLIGCAVARAMERDPGYLADGSQEVVEHVELQANPVPALRSLGLVAIARQLPEIFKNSDQARSLACLPEELRQELWRKHMFGGSEGEVKRNQAVLWLLSQCSVLHSKEHYQDRVFATQLREYNNLSVQIHQNMLLKVVDSNTGGSLLECVSEDPLANVQFSQDGKFLYLIDRGGRIEILSTVDWKSVHQANLPRNRISLRYINFTPDNSAVVCGSVNTLIVRDTLTGESLCDLIRGSQEMIMKVELSVDGNNVFVFYEDAVHIRDENMPALLNAFDVVNLEVQRFDISSLKTMLSQLPHLALEQLLVLHIVHSVIQKRESLDVIAQPHIRAAYDALPDSMRLTIESVLPAIKNYIPGFDMPIPESESAQKRRKVALDLINGVE